MSDITRLEGCGLTFAVLVTYFFVRYLFKTVYCYYIGPAINKVDFKSKGKWALITGCTDGIGKRYAFELAARGCDIVLVSRSMDKLRDTAQEIETQYKVSTKIIQVDFCEENIYEKIEKEVEGLEIGTLVNNVGTSYMYPEYFLDVPDWEKTMTNMFKANIVSTTRMTKLILPAMVKRAKGVIINIGSASSMIPAPMLTVYAATKAYVDKFTEGLEMEYSKKGIIIQCVKPGFVCSNMSGIRRGGLMTPTAKNFVQSAITLVGTMKNTTGYIPHAFFVKVINAIYVFSHKFCVWIVVRSMETSRLKALKKYKRQ